MANRAISGIVRSNLGSSVSVTPSDGVDLTDVGAAIYVGVTGDLKVTMADGVAVVFKNIPVGFHPILVNRVWSTGTTASEILACY
tara:strand:+ start:419 stop:673 length:255 start_codon:yes stop_codon:yes gene_type:complete